MTATKVAGRVVPRRTSGTASDRRNSRSRRHLRIRRKISGTPTQPRLVVNRSSRHVVAQVVDDVAGRTLASASSMDATIRAMEGDKTARSRAVGELVARRAAEVGVTTVVFDRGGNRYHGRIAALADGAREGGLTF